MQQDNVVDRSQYLKMCSILLSTKDSNIPILPVESTQSFHWVWLAISKTTSETKAITKTVYLNHSRRCHHQLEKFFDLSRKWHAHSSDSASSDTAWVHEQLTILSTPDPSRRAKEYYNKAEINFDKYNQYRNIHQLHRKYKESL